MSQAIVKIDPKYLEIVRTSLTNKGLPKPFVQEVELLDCNVAGTSFLDLDDIEPKLKKHQLLMLQRELKNEYDNNAILILAGDFDKVEAKELIKKYYGVIEEAKVENYLEKFDEYLSDYNNPKWVEIATAGRKFTMEKFSNDNAANDLVNLMKSMI